MTNMEFVREAMQRGFDQVDDLGEGILRGERRYLEKPFLVAYVDLADDVVTRSENLTAFQEKLLGSSFFSPDSDLRWNNYLYFLAGPRSKGDPRYLNAKARIESDRHFARKFVVTEEDLSLRLSVGRRSTPTDAAIPKDVSDKWSTMLRDAQLGVLLEQRPRTKALELISTGVAFQSEVHSVTPSLSPQDDPLQLGFLRSLTVGRFRPVIHGK